MPEFKIRTETIKPSRILDFYVETKYDREIVNKLKSESPIVLVGSRGVGKSFLLRVAEEELNPTLR
jgi:ABC-type phosphate/phosphonate transport system ATPase subunit